MSSSITCISSGAPTCVNSTSHIAVGYYCKQNVCIKCPTGTFGNDGKVCQPCPYATWAPDLGQSSCGTTFSYSAAGLQQTYIPFGVTKINVKLWGGGGGGDLTEEDPLQLYFSRSGGGGGYTSCNITVPMSKPIYVIVAGGGGAGNGTMNLGGRYLLLRNRCARLRCIIKQHLSFKAYVSYMHFSLYERTPLHH